MEATKPAAPPPRPTTSQFVIGTMRRHRERTGGNVITVQLTPAMCPRVDRDQGDGRDVELAAAFTGDRLDGWTARWPADVVGEVVEGLRRPMEPIASGVGEVALALADPPVAGGPMKPTALVCTTCEHQEPRWRSTCSICDRPLTPVYDRDVVVTVATWAGAHGWANGRGNGKDRDGRKAAARAVDELLGKGGT